MAKFKQITKRDFIKEMTASSVIFIGGGFTNHSIEEDTDWSDKIINICEGQDIDNAEQCKVRERSTFLERILPDGTKSRLDTIGRKFYRYGNILIGEKKGENGGRNNSVIYLCV